MQVRFYHLMSAQESGVIRTNKDIVGIEEVEWDHASAFQMTENDGRARIFVAPDSPTGNNWSVNAMINGNCLMVWFHEGEEPDLTTITWVIVQ